MRYPIAERFKAIQGEGVYTGTPMAFIRFIGCSVGKGVCTACDTNFDKVYPELGGGMYTVEDLQTWIHDYHHVCITGGEPLDRDLSELLYYLTERTSIEKVHLETSGTILPPWFENFAENGKLWITVSPKPGYKVEMLHLADEIKVIVGGLGQGEGWPTISDAKKWARRKRSVVGIPIYLQPRNLEHHVDHGVLIPVIKAVEANPELRLSVQLHKYIGSR